MTRVSGTAPVERRDVSRRSFAEVLERQERGLGRAEPLPEPVHRHLRPLPPPENADESLHPPMPLPDTFLGLLWWKVKGHQR